MLIGQTLFVMLFTLFIASLPDTLIMDMAPIPKVVEMAAMQSFICGSSFFIGFSIAHFFEKRKDYLL